MFSEAMMERTLLDELQGVLLEDRSGELPIDRIWNKPKPAIEPEHDEAFFPALVWLEHIG